eukprot:gene11072-biopygen1806
MEVRREGMRWRRVRWDGDGGRIGRVWWERVGWALPAPAPHCTHGVLSVLPSCSSRGPAPLTVMRRGRPLPQRGRRLEQRESWTGRRRSVGVRWGRARLHQTDWGGRLWCGVLCTCSQAAPAALQPLHVPSFIFLAAPLLGTVAYHAGQLILSSITVFYTEQGETAADASLTRPTRQHLKKRTYPRRVLSSFSQYHSVQRNLCRAAFSPFVEHRCSTIVAGGGGASPNSPRLRGRRRVCGRRQP